MLPHTLWLSLFHDAIITVVAVILRTCFVKKRSFQRIFKIDYLFWTLGFLKALTSLIITVQLLSKNRLCFSRCLEWGTIRRTMTGWPGRSNRSRRDSGTGQGGATGTGETQVQDREEQQDQERLRYRIGRSNRSRRDSGTGQGGAGTGNWFYHAYFRKF